MGTPIKVKHSQLSRLAGSNSTFVSACPKCPDGLLLLRRDIKTLELQELDLCIGCGQEFLYEDIAQLRSEDPGSQKR